MREMKWISVKDEFPKLVIYHDLKTNTIRADYSREVIVTDGDTSWADTYNLDEGFHPSITHWMHFPEPPTITSYCSCEIPDPVMEDVYCDKCGYEIKLTKHP